jgi:hypothetical protein
MREKGWTHASIRLNVEGDVRGSPRERRFYLEEWT